MNYLISEDSLKLLKSLLSDLDLDIEDVALIQQTFDEIEQSPVKPLDRKTVEGIIRNCMNEMVGEECDQWTPIACKGADQICQLIPETKKLNREEIEKIIYEIGNEIVKEYTDYKIGKVKRVIHNERLLKLIGKYADQILSLAIDGDVIMQGEVEDGYIKGYDDHDEELLWGTYGKLKKYNGKKVKLILQEVQDD
jgi:hypothetical protein